MRNNTKKDYKILPLKIDDKKLGEIDKGENMCKVPHLLLIVGSVRSGKTTLISNLYLNDNLYSRDYGVKILVCPTANTDVMYKAAVEQFDYVFDDVSNIDLLIAELIEMIEKDETDQKYIIVFDDIVGSSLGKRGKIDAVTALSTKYRHIGNKNGEGKLSICIAVQYFKHLNIYLRSNCSGLYVCGAMGDTELKKIADNYEHFGGSKSNFIDLYKKARQNPYDFLFLNTHSFKAFRNHEECLWSFDEQFNKTDDNNKNDDNIIEVKL